VGIPEKSLERFDGPGTCRNVLSPDDGAIEAESFLSEWGKVSIIGISGFRAGVLRLCMSKLPDSIELKGK